VESVREQIVNFVQKCEDVKNCKFIMATAKIKDLLKAIVNSAELYELFTTVAANFNYPAAKRSCFIEGNRCKVVLPETVGDRLAFIFCLLVEFDHGDINFNAFLQKYFPKDGSFYSSYHLFCDEVIANMENIICDIYAAELAAPPEKSGATQHITTKNTVSPAEDYTAVLILIDAEREAVTSSLLSEDDKAAAIGILTALAAAVKSGDRENIGALTCGYNYFALYTGVVSPTLSELFEGLSALAQ